MAYTTPRTWVTGETVTAALLNAHVRDNISYLNTKINLDILVYEDQKAQNTAGGTFTQDAWQTHVLNVEVVDAGARGALASNQVTLATGTYFIFAWAQGHDVDKYQLRWYNISDSNADVSGLNCDAAEPDSVQIPALLMGCFTTAAEKIFELQAYCTTTQAGDGYGKAMNIGTEVYAQVMLARIA